MKQDKLANPKAFEIGARILLHGANLILRDLISSKQEVRKKNATPSGGPLLSLCLGL